MGALAYPSLRTKFHRSHWIYTYLLGVILSYLLHICCDELLNMSYIISKSPFVFGYPRNIPFDWIIYAKARIKNIVTLGVMVPALAYKRVYERFHVSKYSLLTFGLMCYKWFYQASNRLVDYAGLTGWDRVVMFYRVYPVSYLLYGLFFLSIIKRGDVNESEIPLWSR